MFAPKQYLKVYENYPKVNCSPKERMLLPVCSGNCYERKVVLAVLNSAINMKRRNKITVFLREYLKGK